MSALRYYIYANPWGDIVLAHASVASISDNPFPVQMVDEYGKILPYAEQGPYNHGCLPLDLNGSNEFFRRIEIEEEQFQLVGNVQFFHWRYNKNGRKIELRPGHMRILCDGGMWRKSDKYVTMVHDPDNALKRTCIAYGGRPIYQIKEGTGKVPDDYPELRRQGCLLPSYYRGK